MRFPRFITLASALLLIAAPGSVAGQSGLRISGVSVERFSGDDYRFVALAYRRTELARSGAGLDLGLGLVPELLRARVALVEVDVGPTRAQSIGPVTLLLKGGVSSFIALLAENEFYPGLQAGVAAIIPLERRCGLRLDLNRHFYFPQEGPFQLWSVGIGLVVH